MKQFIFTFAMLLVATFSFAQTSPEIRNQLSNDPTFRQLVSDVMYGIAVDVVNDTSSYAISTRPAFDKMLTNPNNAFFTDMFTKTVLNHPSVSINPEGDQTLSQQLEFAFRTLTLWKGPIEAFIRQNKGIYAFPLNLDSVNEEIETLKTQVTTLEGQVTTLEGQVATLQTENSTQATTITNLTTRIEALESAGQ